MQTITWIVGNPSLWSQTNRVPSQTEESNLSDSATCWLTYLRPQRWLFSLFLEIVIMIIISIELSPIHIYRILSARFENYVSLIIIVYIFVWSRKVRHCVFGSSVTRTQNCIHDKIYWFVQDDDKPHFVNRYSLKLRYEIIFKNLWFCKDFIVRLK